MDYFIKELQIDKNDNYTHVGGENNWLSNLSKINIFVGSNNSGKSRYIRNIFNTTSFGFKPAQLDLMALNSLIDSYKKDVTLAVQRFHINDYGNIVSRLEAINHYEYFLNDTNYLDGLLNHVNLIKTLDTNQSVTQQRLSIGSFYDNHHAALRKELNEIGVSYLDKINALIGSTELHNYNFKKVYIPTLRGLRTFNTEEDHYLNRTILDYFPELKDRSSIFTGQEMYEIVKELLLGDLDEREKISDFQRFLGDAFFDGQAVALIPSINSDVLNVKIGKEKERPIFGLGDGIQSLIILTFPLFINRDENLLVFVEEPELYLHPGLQRKLVETFASFENYQYFITTHSNHFLDLTLDIEQISIYTFRKQLENEESKREITANFLIENTSNEDHSILEMIGVKNSSVFLSNCTIWVEGITDRYYLRHYLKLYIESIQDPKKMDYKEDLHYSFVEYSGGNITHWSFLDGNNENDPTYRSMNADRLCSRLFLITDKDSESKFERQNKLKRKLGKRYYCLECREVENLIKKEVLEKVIAEYEGKKIDQLRFRQEVTEADYKEVPLGGYIQHNLLNKQRRGSYKSPSGTISDKLGFCKKVIYHTEDINDLSFEALKLVKKIYNFIVENNK